jgi:hypothetical protein
MPFAAKFWAAMELPFPGDAIGGFEVEHVQVEHHALGGGRYDYPVRLVLKGKGGKQGARKALRDILAARRTTFSGFGNPYQCWIDNVDIQSLGDQRYEVRARGIGVRIYLRKELERFWDLLAAEGRISIGQEDRAAYLDSYMEEYMKGITRSAARYRRKIKRAAETA